MTRPDLASALRDGELVHDRDTLRKASARIGGDVSRALAGQSAVFLSILQGGLVFAGQLATEIDADLEFDYVRATRFRGTTEGGELHWLRRPGISLHGRIVLLVDDILDEGHTLKAIRDWCVAEGASRVLLAVLCENRHGRTVAGLTADFVGVEVPDRYVFGYGMDYHEQGRNLPAIHAL